MSAKDDLSEKFCWQNVLNIFEITCPWKDFEFRVTYLWSLRYLRVNPLKKVCPVNLWSHISFPRHYNDPKFCHYWVLLFPTWWSSKGYRQSTSSLPPLFGLLLRSTQSQWSLPIKWVMWVTYKTDWLIKVTLSVRASWTSWEVTEARCPPKLLHFSSASPQNSFSSLQ